MRAQARQYLDGVVRAQRSQHTGTIVMMVNTRQYAAAGEVGLPKARKAAQKIAAKSPTWVWGVVCVAHDYLLPLLTLAAARDETSRPDGWCPACAAPIGPKT